MNEMPRLHPGIHAIADPDRPAIIMGDSGQVISFAELEERSRRLSQLFRVQGLKTGDSIALLMDNRAEYLVITWAAQRSGLYFTPVNWHLKI
ncbi:MAG: AMP-binding protein, partial [Sphingomonadales bacterium]